MSLCCPECSSDQDLGTIERLSGIADCSEITADGPDWTGSTEVFFDTSETVGIACRCGWEYEGPDWIKQLS